MIRTIIYIYIYVTLKIYELLVPYMFFMQLAKLLVFFSVFMRHTFMFFLFDLFMCCVCIVCICFLFFVCICYKSCPNVGLIEGDIYPPTYFQQLSASLLSYIFMVGLILLFAGEAIFNALNIPVGLALVRRMKENQVRIKC